MINNNNFDDRIKYLKRKEKTNDDYTLKNYGLNERVFNEKINEDDISSLKNNINNKNNNIWKNKKPLDNYSKYDLAPLFTNEIYTGKLSNIIVSTNNDFLIGKIKPKIKLDFEKLNNFEGINFFLKDHNTSKKNKNKDFNDIEFPLNLKFGNFASPVISRKIFYNNFDFNKPKGSQHYSNGVIDLNSNKKNDIIFNPKFNILNEYPKKILSFNKKNLKLNPNPISNSNKAGKRFNNYINFNSNNDFNFDNNNNNKQFQYSSVRNKKYNLVERSLSFINNHNKSAI
jgi:hypothetical protein